MATRGKEMEMTPYHVKMSMNRVICSCISTSEKLNSLHLKCLIYVYVHSNSHFGPSRATFGS